MSGSMTSEVVKCNYINLNKQCMITRNWETVYKILGDELFSHLYKEYIIFLKTRDDSLVQISGTNIFVYLNDKLGRLQQAFYEGDRRTKEGAGATNAAGGEGAAKEADLPPPVRKHIPSHKYNIKHAKDDYTANINKSFWDDIVNRNRLFYCTHMNRKNAFFQKHILNSKTTPREIVNKIYKDMFGFTRIRKSVSQNVMKMLNHVVKAQKKFDYNYYLTKNCPLPTDWKNKKKQLIEKAKLGGESRG